MTCRNSSNLNFSKVSKRLFLKLEKLHVSAYHMSHMENMVYKLKSSDFLFEPQRIGYFGRKDLVKSFLENF